ncbi:MAG: alcohol dehydrogenase catalytic domain-containing protein [Fimbriiglobus sp.]|nr:alcohol dehydrogenase catalytic domain-containing protein [Fimbriiglobus sp.]
MPTAYYFDGPGQPLRPEVFALPAPGPGEAVVRVSLCTLCGSDLHTYFGRRAEPTPVVLGHEMVGVVERLPNKPLSDIHGEPLRVGDRITWSVIGACGHCFPCTHDLPQKCDTLFKYGKKTGGPFGGLTTHCHLLNGTAAVKLPADLPDEAAAPLMCATATAAACLRAVGPIETLLVTGAGLLGLSACAMASAAGVWVVVCDRDDARVALAKQFGATDGWPERIDAAVEMSGAADPTRFALSQVRTGGTLVLAGSVTPTPPIELHPEEVVRRCLRIVGVHNYTPADLLTAVRFMGENQRRFPFAELVSRVFPLSEVGEAFAFAAREKPIRVGVRA